MTCSLCESCTRVREVLTPKGSRFLLCQLSQTDPDYPKYPPQPVVRCDGYQQTAREESMEKVNLGVQNTLCFRRQPLQVPAER